MSLPRDSTTSRTPSPPSGAAGLWPASAATSQQKNQMMLPVPDLSTGVNSQNSAADAVSTTIGNATTANGSSSDQRSIDVDSPRANCITSAVVAITTSIDVSTSTL